MSPTPPSPTEQLRRQRNLSEQYLPHCKVQQSAIASTRLLEILNLHFIETRGELYLIEKKIKLDLNQEAKG
jgi:hypothetical protein